MRSGDKPPQLTTIQSPLLLLRAILLALVTLSLCSNSIATDASSGAKVSEVLGQTKIGGRFQSLFLLTESEAINARDKFDFTLRRARLRFKNQAYSNLTFFLQTDISENKNSSAADLKVIDAWASYRIDNFSTIYIGQHMAPASRQNLTHAGGIMALDRPSITYKTLGWGTRARARFTTYNLGHSDAGLDSAVGVRDTGLTYFYSNSLSSHHHLKLYFGTYDGAVSARGERLTARLQMNFGEDEKGYFQQSTYLGNKRTLAIGFSIDHQNEVALDAHSNEAVSYRYISADLYAELPFAAGTVNFDSAWMQLDLDNAHQLANFVTLSPLTASSNSGLSSAGQGAYFQGGFLRGRWQPWFNLEYWNSKDTEDEGDFGVGRVGLSYFFDGHNLNVKLGLEQFTSDTPISAALKTDDKITSLAIGLFYSF